MLYVKIYLVYKLNNVYYPVCNLTFVQEVICIPIHPFNGTLTESAIDFSSVLSFSFANTRAQACILCNAASHDTITLFTHYKELLSMLNRA